MDTKTIIIYSTYILTTIAFIVRDILWLRILMTVGSVFWIFLGTVLDEWAIIIFNALYLVINGFQIIKLFLERRPVDLPEWMQKVYDARFTEMSQKEFLTFWHMGKRKKVNDDIICRQGEVPEDLNFILSGKISVFKERRVLAYLESGNFIAEMSFLTKEPASADVKAEGEAEVWTWPQENLRGLKLATPDLFIKLQVILGKELSGKLKSSVK